MNSPLGCKALLAQLDNLKETVRTLTARANQLNVSHRERTTRENTAFDSREQQRVATGSKRLAAEVDAFENAQVQLDVHFKRQKTWIDQTLTRANEKILADIARQETDCKARAHEYQVQAETQRDEALATESGDWESFQEKWTALSSAFQQFSLSLRGAFGGYPLFRRALNTPPSPGGAPAQRNEAIARFQQLQTKLDSDLVRFKRLPLPALFRFVPIWLLGLLLLGFIGTQQVMQHMGNHALTTHHTVIAAGALVAAVVLYVIGWRTASAFAKALAADYVSARRLLDMAWQQGSEQHQLTLERIDAEFQKRKTGISQTWRQESKVIVQRQSDLQNSLEQRGIDLQQKNSALRQKKLQDLKLSHQNILANLHQQNEAEARNLTASRDSRLAAIESEFDDNWRALAADWQNQVLPVCQSLQSASSLAEKLFPGWLASAWEGWTPPTTFLNAVKLGRLEVDLEKFLGGLPADPRLSLEAPSPLSLPLVLTHPQQGSLLLETGKEGGEEAIGAINHIILQLLATNPPGRLEFTIFDPVGMGQNFASLMHLADYEASTINSRIWTQTAQFEEKLAELNEHMEKIIQMYLRNEYATITEYNADAGSIAEKYHFLVIASFPVNFSETACKRLRNIAANGARCGVFLLVQWDQRSTPPQDFVPDELQQNTVRLVRSERGFEMAGWQSAGTKVILGTPPPPEFTTQLLHRVGDAGKNSNRVEVPFAQIAPAFPDVWSERTTEELRVPIGRSGATKWQYLSLGRDTRQHVLIAGKTGSGKSTLFHIIITNLALRCSPEQVEFYLVDFKKGVEFKCYGNHHLPHARVVAIESDRAFGLSVLQRVDEELRRRGDLFRKVGAQDLPGYQRNGGNEPIPRTLLMIDEFQEFFVEDDRVSQSAAVLLDRIVRQGRAFGIHVILGSQTLGGAYTLARATLGQMAIRIALQCNEADALLIMDQDNPAPRLLSRPGEGIYNDAAGAIEGNSPFQAVWLSDRTREDYLSHIRTRADHSGRNYPGPLVFEGNAPADVRENFRLNAALKGEKISRPSRVWLGAPNAIKDPTEAVFRRQSAANLLVVGQNEERGLIILSVALVSLAAQHSLTGVQFFVLHNVPTGVPHSDYFQNVVRAIPQPMVQAGNGNLAKVMTGLSAELKRRQEIDSAEPEIFVLIHDLQNFKKLRQEDDFSFSSSTTEASPASVFLELLTEGPARGIHVILTCDSYGNLTRFVNRKNLGEIEMRVVFQMSASDSASLIDAPDASTLGLHRALLFNEREGTLETFRPYALPDNDWVEKTAKQLAPQPAESRTDP